MTARSAVRTTRRRRSPIAIIRSIATIRPLEHGDLAAVARLARANLPGWSRDEASLARGLLEHPWTPDPPPSLVAVAGDGRVIGSIGAQRRPLLFDDATLEAIAVSHLVVDPEERGGASGALLVRSLLGGGQDLTFTDSGTAEVVRIWRAFGGRLDHSRTLDWVLVFRPARWARSVGSIVLRRRGAPPRAGLPIAAMPLHALGARVMPRAHPSIPEGIEGADSSIGEVAAGLGELTRGTRLRVDYDGETLGLAFSHADSAADGEVVRRIVRRGGRAIGWYAYIQRPVVSRVVCLGAQRGEADGVVAELAETARRRGVAVLTGRLEPHLDEPLRRRFAALGFGQRPILHSHDPAVLAALSSSRSLLTELDLIDTEWW